MTSIIIPDSVTEIGERAFNWCYGLTSIIIPVSVTKISKAAFEHCNILEKVYYNGTAEDWSEMSIGADNSHFTSATRYYYSEEQPTEAGSFWHYVDGEVVEW